MKGWLFLPFMYPSLEGSSLLLATVKASWGHHPSGLGLGVSLSFCWSCWCAQSGARQEQLCLPVRGGFMWNMQGADVFQDFNNILKSPPFEDVKPTWVDVWVYSCGGVLKIGPCHLFCSESVHAFGKSCVWSLTSTKFFYLFVLLSVGLEHNTNWHLRIELALGQTNTRTAAPSQRLAGKSWCCTWK